LISKEFKKLIRQSAQLNQISSKEMFSLQFRLSNVLSTVGVGRNFGTVISPYYCDLYIIQTSIDFTYLLGKIYFPDHHSLKKLQVQQKIMDFSY